MTPSSAVDVRRQPHASRRMDWSSLIRRHAAAKPAEVAVRFGGQSITWKELDDRCSRMGGWLAEQGVVAGDRVVLLLANRPEFIEGVVAANRVGAIAVPVNFRLSTAEVEFIVGDASPTAIITESGLVSLLSGVDSPSVQLVVDREPVCPAMSANLDAPEYSTDDPAVIIYTSGTTGRPKGAVLSHLNLQAQGLALIRGWQLFEDDAPITLLCLPMFHVGGFTIGTAFLLVGGTMVIQPSGAFDAVETLGVLERERVSSVFMVPTQWQAIVESGVGSRELVLRVLAWGGAPMSTTVLEQLSTLFPAASVVAVFGQTEMTPVSFLSGRDARRKLGSVGRPVDTISVRVVDEELNDVPLGEIGELVYRGPGLLLGYWGRPDATAEAFDGGWFHSGDLAFIDAEGFIYVVDRKKDMIISGGENIYTAEVESALSGHPDIGEVAVIGRPDQRWGEVPVAVVVPRSRAGSTLDLESLNNWLDGRLARYKRPKAVEVVDTLPRNASGKVLKHALKAVSNQSGQRPAHQYKSNS
ncbi:AMP-binding protein [Mycobacterium vicinigordonae]|uniref:Long-chain-fatty-acid--CoA ligase FadD13 n=1 Tax=Mycobacterium vicinigordonae TaxID=1719132 RepID=A0A7D6DZV7_9MYCO|nr:AMP-binding protein [Mycobacterium vicinigordonae]QLL07570.1 AMP-binding protein [Mycobacterium vicinigordonae]